MTLQNMIDVRAHLRKCFLGLCIDFREYLKRPVETVSIEQVKYQLDFTLREIRQIDTKITNLMANELRVCESAVSDDFEKLQKVAPLVDVDKLPLRPFDSQLNAAIG